MSRAIDEARPRVLIVANAFEPSVGGYEWFCQFLAKGLSDHFEVNVLTDTPSDESFVVEDSKRCFTIHRRPDRRTCRALAATAQIVVFNSVSLKYLSHLWPYLARSIVIHHTGYRDESSLRVRSTEILKRLLASGFRRNVAVSRYVATRVCATCAVVHNPYDDDLFRPGADDRPKRALFVGRLVPEKGAHLLVRSMPAILRHDPEWRATVVGDGPELAPLKKMAGDLGVSGAIDFRGAVDRNGVAHAMREHRILVAPSLREPFGIVALEGLASACAVVHADCDGLPEAAGGFGTPFKSGDVASLTSALIRVIDASAESPSLSPSLKEYLKTRSKRAVLAEYRRIIEPLLSRTLITR
jgi:glycosyltransferase involved in cell wall biosynthesis